MLPGLSFSSPLLPFYPIFPSCCEGKLRVALESLHRDHMPNSLF